MPEVEVMTFNLRRISRADGKNNWPYRKQHAAEAILSAKAEIVGTQEGLPLMLDQLDALLPGYARVGEGRGGGKKDEHCAIYYAVDRWQPVEQGTFWLSETPEQPGKRGWGAAFPRICTWAVFEAKDESCARLAVYNVHLDHISGHARVKGAALAAARLMGRRSLTGEPAVLLGDFNSPSNSKAVSQLSAPPYRLADAYGAYIGGASAVGATYHAFRGGGVGDKPIDYIFATDDLRIERVVVDRNRYGGKYPSDHYPISAKFALP
jgi:endonuclease/exonuclease/phosphatase family metal-dependent hydrolase